MVEAEQEKKPDWWIANEEVKSSFDLPKYEPPKFSDGAYVHDVVEPLERKYGIKIDFIGINTRYPDDWQVRIDYESVMTIERRRGKNGNTLYLMDSEDFHDAIVKGIRSS